MPTWALILTISLIIAGLAMAIVVTMIAVQFSRACGLVQRKPWEEQ